MPQINLSQTEVSQIQTTTLELCCNLVARPSITPYDAGCQALIKEHLELLGFSCRDMSVGTVTNLWATTNASKDNNRPMLVFAGHTDVVPAGEPENWVSQPFSPTIRDGYLYGRGVADMKASLAAMLTAMHRLLNSSPQLQGNIGFLLTSDEEGLARDGTKAVISQLMDEGTRIDWCVVGEPSSQTVLGDQIRNGRRGSLNAELTMYGQQGHVAYPNLATNPIPKAMKTLVELNALEWDKGNEYFPPTSLQITSLVSGAGAENITPGKIQARFNLRFNNLHSATSIQQKICHLLEQTKLRYSINWHLSGNPFLTKPGKFLDTVQRVIKNVTGTTPLLTTHGGTSDGRFIAPYGIDVVEFGPINASIHKINENCAISDLVPLSVSYEHIARVLLGSRD